MSSLKLEPLEKAILQFEKGIVQNERNPTDDLLRDGVIHRFKFSIDLMCKVIENYLRQDLQIEDSVIRSKKDIFREAARLKLIDDAAWIAHYNARNSIFQNYCEALDTIYQQALIFLSDAKKLLQVLKDVE